LSYLGKQGVEAVDLLPLFDEGVVLSYASEGELLHQIYLVGVVDVLVLGGREGGREGLIDFVQSREFLFGGGEGGREGGRTYLKGFDSHGEGGGEEPDLTVRRAVSQEALEDWLEGGRDRFERVGD